MAWLAAGGPAASGGMRRVESAIYAVLIRLQ